MSSYDQSGDNYRGGYGGGVSLDPADIRDNSRTFEDYEIGTTRLVLMIFFVFCLISLMTLCLMGYARHLSRRKPKYGFYKPPDMLLRYPRKNPKYSTLPRSDYSQATTQPQMSSMAASQGTLGSHTTAASTMLWRPLPHMFLGPSESGITCMSLLATLSSYRKIVGFGICQWCGALIFIYIQ